MTIILRCELSEPTSYPLPVPDEPIGIFIDYNMYLSLCNSLWNELHAKQDPTVEWFEQWISRVPSFGCGCKPWLREYLSTNAPDYGNGWYEWTVTLHDAVNAKLGKPAWNRLPNTPPHAT